MALNVLDCCFSRVKEFLPKAITAIFLKQYGVADFLLHRQVETKAQRLISLRIACNDSEAETVAASLRFQVTNRSSAPATPASSIASNEAEASRSEHSAHNRRFAFTLGHC